jgi:hypothetical protein
VALSFDVVSTLSLQSEEDKQKTIVRQSIRRIVLEEMESISQDIIVDEIDITIPDTRTDPEKMDANIIIRIKQFGEVPLEYKDLQRLKNYLEFKLNISAMIEIEFIPLSRLNETSLEAGVYNDVEIGLEAILWELSEKIYVEELSIKEEFVSVKLFVPDNVVITQYYKGELQSFINDKLGEEFELNLQVVRYELQ